MTVWEAIVLGAIQGATEFLPVSSSGHLVVGQALLGIEIPGIGFEIAVHLATLLSVLVAYRAEFAELVFGALKGEREALTYWLLVALATLPVVVVGLLYKDRIEALFDAPIVAGFCFLFTAAVLLTTRWALARDPDKEPSVASSVAMGFAQIVALLPGVSRSGMTVTAALWSGLDPKKAAQFSFMMLLPAVSGASILSIPDLTEGGLGVGMAPLLAGFASAAIVGVLAIKVFIVMLKNRSFPLFAGYLALLGIGFIFWLQNA